MVITKHIVVTGASGFLGKHLLNSFLSGPTTQQEADEVEYHIYALYHKHANFALAVENYQTTKCPHNSWKIQTCSLDLTDADAVHDFCDATTTGALSRVEVVDVCIHLAALANPGPCQENPELARAINIPRHFFQAMIDKKRCKRIIALSTDHVYPGTKPPYSDDDSIVWKPINVYGSTKYEMERYLLEKQQQSNEDKSRNPLEVILLRSSIILGNPAPIVAGNTTTEQPSGFLQFCASRRNQETLFWTDEKRSVIGVNDVITVLRWFVAAEQQTVPTGVFNMGGPKSVSRYDMAKAVFEQKGYETKFYLVGMAKGQQSAQNPRNGGPPTPLDISMDSSRLHSLIISNNNKKRHKFATLEDIVQAMYPN